MSDEFAGGVAFFSEEFFGGLAFFDPGDDGFVEVDGCGAGATEAVVDAGGEKEAGEFGGGFWAGHVLLEAFVIMNAAGGGDELVREAVIDDDFSAAIAEAGEIGIVGADDIAVLLDGLLEMQGETGGSERGEVPFRILQEEILEPFEGDAEGAAFEWRTGGACECEEVRSTFESIPKEGAVRSARAFPDFSDNVRVRFSEGVTADFCAHERFGIIIATEGIIDDAVFHSVHFVARGDGGGGSRFELRARDPIVRVGHDDLRPENGGNESLPVDRGTAGENAVVIFGKTLCFHQTLAAASGATNEIGIARFFAVKRFGERFADDGHFVNAEVGVVLNGVPIEAAIFIERKTPAAAFVAGVGCAGDVTLARRTDHARGITADITAAAVAAEASVPISEWKGDPNFDAIFGGRMSDRGGDAAKIVGWVQFCGIDDGVRDREVGETFA